MPTAARRHQLQNTLVYHVINRGHAKQALFHDPDDHERFKALLARYAQEHRVSIYHWVLMPNHYHLCLELQRPEGLSRIMAGIQRAYVHYHHRKHQMVGYLFQGRFKSQPIQKERHLLACGRYIEQNPLKANLAGRAEDFHYSSARFYVTGENDGLTTENPLYLTLGRTDEERRQAYREFLQLPEGEQVFEHAESPVGEPEFLNKLVLKRGRLVGRRRGAVTGFNSQLIVNKQEA